MRVLLIEDDFATAHAIELILKLENFDCCTTCLGEDGLNLGKLNDYDIILLDLKLPDPAINASRRSSRSFRNKSNASSRRSLGLMQCVWI